MASMRTFLPPILSVVFANVLMFTGSIFLLFGAAQFINVSLRKKPYLVLSTAFTLSYCYFTFIDPNIRMRLILFTSLILPVFIHTVWIIMVSADHKNRKFAFGVGIVHILYSIDFILRALHGTLNGEIPDYFNTPLDDTFFVIISLLLMIVLTSSLEYMLGMKLMDQIDAYIEEKDLLLNQTEILAATDPLTQLYNRRKIETIIQNRIEDYQHFGIPFTLLIADIDHFKKLNDTYGHDIGDQALIHVTKILRKNIRNTDSLGRWGGEEFIILLNNAPLETGFGIGQKLVEQISQSKCAHLKKDDTITISIGIAEMKTDTTINHLIKEADDALYKAKNLGRNRIEVLK